MYSWSPVSFFLLMTPLTWPAFFVVQIGLW
jgi:hypothetical protein